MSHYVYLIRAKEQFASHVHQLLTRYACVDTIEELYVEKMPSDAGTMYDEDQYRPKRPNQSHTLFLVTCSAAQDQIRQFNEMLENGKTLDLVYQVDVFKIMNEE